MRLHTLLLPLLTLLALLASLPAALASSSRPTQPEGLDALDGVWIFVEDRTEGRAPEQLGPPMSSTFSFAIHPDAVILVTGHGSGHKDVRVALDGSITEVPGERAGSTARYRAEWKDGTLTTNTDFIRAAGQDPEGLIRREFRPTPEGILVTVVHPFNPDGSVALYRHPEDVPMPTPAKAAIADIQWLSGAWVGTRSSGSSIEERWSPPLGGAMLATSRTVNPAGKMVAFEYLRIVERAGGLFYIAQPGGSSPTEFTLTEITPTRAVFENPRHDHPKRIVYELSADGSLSASVGQLKGGTPRRFDFQREAK